MAVEKEKYTIEIPVNVHGWTEKSVKVEVEATTQWAAVEALGAALTHLVARAPQPNQHGVDPDVMRTIKRFLHYSLEPAGYEYDQLTVAERQMVTREQFADLVKWLNAGRR